MKTNVPAADLAKVLRVLDAMRGQKIIERYAIGGAFAAVLHYEPISTVDLDIFFLYSETDRTPILSLEKIYEFARSEGFSFDHEFINIHGWLVQFVEASHSPLWKDAVENADHLDIDGIQAAVIGKEYLIAMWLNAGRAKDFLKIQMFLEGGIVDRSELSKLLGRYGLAEEWNKQSWRFQNE